MLGYLAASALLVAACWGKLPDAWLFLLGHAGAAALLVAYIRVPGLPAAHFARHWYLVPYIVALYREMGLLIPVVRGTDYDAMLARWDYALWGVHPTVWLERIQTPWLTEFLQVAYSLFVPAVVLLPVLLYCTNRLEEGRSFGFLLCLGFLTSYVVYLIVPARGPRFLLDVIQTKPLEGLWLTTFLREGLDVLESAHYDCFPSGHMEMTLLAWWYSRRISGPLFWFFSVYTLLIVVSTVYLRYHYTVDLIAGLITAAAVYAVWSVLETGNTVEPSRR